MSKSHAFALKAVFYDETDSLQPSTINGAQRPSLAINDIPGSADHAKVAAFWGGTGGALIMPAYGWKIHH